MGMDFKEKEENTNGIKEGGGIMETEVLGSIRGKVDEGAWER